MVGGICSSDLQAAQTEHKDTRGAACTCSSSTSGQSLEFRFAGTCLSAGVLLKSTGNLVGFVDFLRNLEISTRCLLKESDAFSQDP